MSTMPEAMNPSLFPDEVLALCTNTPKSQLCCPECKTPANKGRPYYDSPEDAWAILLYCHCTAQWVVCGLCTTNRIHMRKPSAIRWHGWNKHRATTTPVRKKIRTGTQAEKNDQDNESEDDMVEDVDNEGNASPDAQCEADGDMK
jgi:hypothetical protein